MKDVYSKDDLLSVINDGLRKSDGYFRTFLLLAPLKEKIASRS